MVGGVIRGRTGKGAEDMGDAPGEKPGNTGSGAAPSPGGAVVVAVRPSDAAFAGDDTGGANLGDAPGARFGNTGSGAAPSPSAAELVSVRPSGAALGGTDKGAEDVEDAPVPGLAIPVVVSRRLPAALNSGAPTKAPRALEMLRA